MLVRSRIDRKDAWRQNSRESGCVVLNNAAFLLYRKFRWNSYTVKASKLAAMRTSRSGSLCDASARARECAASAHFIFGWDKMKKRILITGGSGFVGRNVKEYLEAKEQYEVYAPTSKQLDCLDESAVRAYLEEHHFDDVLHFAVYGDGIDKSKDGTKSSEYNLRIYLNFANNADLYGRMFYTGSGAEYDKRYPICHVTETDIGKHIPADGYGVVKYAIGQMIENSTNIYNLRLFGIYGKYEYYPVKFISNVCCKMIKGIAPAMRQNVYFDYLWVEDFCRIVELFLAHDPKYHTYNIVSGKAISLAEIVAIVQKISGKDLPVHVCREGLANEYTASNERFLEEWPEFEFTGQEKAIESLYHWYEEHGDQIDLYQLLY